MKISRKNFVISFLISALAFQFISNALLGPEVRLFPLNGDWFPTGAPVVWKSTVATIIYPIKLVLIGPLASFFRIPDPDSAPPVILAFFAFYWTVMALTIHFLLSKIIARKKNE